HVIRLLLLRRDRHSESATSIVLDPESPLTQTLFNSGAIVGKGLRPPHDRNVWRRTIKIICVHRKVHILKPGLTLLIGKRGGHDGDRRLPLAGVPLLGYQLLAQPRRGHSSVRRRIRRSVVCPLGGGFGL